MLQGGLVGHKDTQCSVTPIAKQTPVSDHISAAELSASPPSKPESAVKSPSSGVPDPRQPQNPLPSCSLEESSDYGDWVVVTRRRNPQKGRSPHGEPKNPSRTLKKPTEVQLAPTKPTRPRHLDLPGEAGNRRSDGPVDRMKDVHHAANATAPFVNSSKVAPMDTGGTRKGSESGSTMTKDCSMEVVAEVATPPVQVPSFGVHGKGQPNKCLAVNSENISFKSRSDNLSKRKNSSRLSGKSSSGKSRSNLEACTKALLAEELGKLGSDRNISVPIQLSSLDVSVGGDASPLVSQ